MRPHRIVIALFTACIAAVFIATYLIMATIFGQGSDQTMVGGSSSCTATVNTPTSSRLDQEQLVNAYTIVQVGVSRGVSARGLIIALATALQESTLRNLHYGDRDSVGLFQQRPSSGWGSIAELTDPSTASAKFYSALARVPNWQEMPLTEAAQAVQRSAFPLAYTKWENLATTLVHQMLGETSSSQPNNASINSITCGQVVGDSTPNNASGGMLQIALSQVGKPYVWGATGPDSFDCSGLIVFSWRKAGYSLSVRTSEQMYQVSDPVRAGSEQPGDLLFGDFGAAGPGHVMIVVRPGVAVEAPHTGDVVKVISYDPDKWTFGRLQASAFVAGTIPG